MVANTCLCNLTNTIPRGAYFAREDEYDRAAEEELEPKDQAAPEESQSLSQMLEAITSVIASESLRTKNHIKSGSTSFHKCSVLSATKDIYKSASFTKYFPNYHF